MIITICLGVLLIAAYILLEIDMRQRRERERDSDFWMWWR